jgi:hypothetical protein
MVLLRRPACACRTHGSPAALQAVQTLLLLRLALRVVDTGGLQATHTAFLVAARLPDVACDVLRVVGFGMCWAERRLVPVDGFGRRSVGKTEQVDER